MLDLTLKDFCHFVNVFGTRFIRGNAAVVLAVLGREFVSSTTADLARAKITAFFIGFMSVVIFTGVKVKFFIFLDIFTYPPVNS